MLLFSLLGRFAIETENALLEPPRGRQARSLLAWLALHPGPHPRARLAARFWPDVLDRSARASLRVALSEVRAALGPAAGCLIADRTQAGLAADLIRVDALELADLADRNELEAALDLYQGELLPDLDDDWVLDERDGYAATVVEILARLASERETGGDLSGAISLSRRMTAIDPLGEKPTRELMRRLAAAGERGAALAAYHRLSARLAQLKIAPSPATRTLAEQLRSAEGETDAEGAHEPASATNLDLAVSHYRQALAKAPAGDERHCELLLSLGAALAHAGRTAEARTTCEEASELAERLEDPVRLARATLGLAGIGVTILELDEPLAGRLAAACERLPESEPGLRAELLARLAIARAYSPDRSEAARIADQAVELARRHGDPATLARALCARHAGLGAPDRLADRLATAAEMLELATRAGDRESALQAQNFRVADLLESGDLPGFDRELDTYAALCHQTPLPAFRWYVPLWRATRATIDGDFAEAQRLAERARTIGREAGDDNAEHFWRLQTGTLLLLQGHFDGDTGWIEDHARTSPAGSAWWTVLAWLWAEQGRDQDARAVLDRLAAHDFAAVDYDTNWISAVAELVLACRRLDDRERAATLYQRLLPFTGRIVTSARAAQTYGPVDYFLALAAHTAGQPTAARGHLHTALQLSEAAGATSWIQAIRQEL
jgi:DNA-binding SARP family transcriptional activator